MQVADILRFFDAGVSSFHVSRAITDRLVREGFQILDAHDSWDLQWNRYVFRHGASVIAFRFPEADPTETGAVIVASHVDSPALEMKFRSAVVDDGILHVPVELYGSPIVASWLDRELLLAGRVSLKTGRGSTRTLLYKSRKPLAVIPNLAIHLNRTVNDGATYNAQDHLHALFGLVEDSGTGDSMTPRDVLVRLIAKDGGFDPQAFLDAELYLVPAQRATRIGAADDMITAGHIDNLAGSLCNLEAICNAANTPHLQMAVFYDHEEIGSKTMSGAAGAMLERALRRILPGPGMLERMLGRTVLISNDGAHARHPAYKDKHDPGYAPRLGGGPVIKKSAARRYATELPASAWFASVCDSAGVPLQYLQNRSDIPAGSTIGPLQASSLGVPAIDIGIPMLAMHSSRELVATADMDLLTRAVTAALGEKTDDIFAADQALEDRTE